MFGQKLSTWAFYRFAVLATVGACTLPSGCVRRRLTVRTNPPGARVYIDDQEIGTTPVSTSFVYYGTRKIRIVRDGFETMSVLETFRPPWYQIPPLDYITENLVPWELRDERILDFELVPRQLVPNYQLLERANNIRQGARQGFFAPRPVTDPTRGVGLPQPRIPADAYSPSPQVPLPGPPGRSSSRLWNPN